MAALAGVNRDNPGGLWKIASSELCPFRAVYRPASGSPNASSTLPGIPPKRG